MESGNKDSFQSGGPDSIIQKFTSIKPKCRNTNDSVVLILHLLMKENGFLFFGCGDKNDESANDALPISWNKSDDSYTFRYKSKEGKTVLLKAIVLEGQLLIHALFVGDKNMHNLTIAVDEFINPDVALDNYEKLFKNIDTLMTLFTLDIIEPLNSSPEVPVASEKEAPKKILQDPIQDYDPLRIPSRYQPRPSPLADPSFGNPYATPFGSGHSDVFPDIPGGPGGLFGGPGSGNLIGPNHPGFNPGFQNPSRGRGRGQFPGARFDPYGPPGFGNQFGNPDNDELPPPKGPGYDNMFL